MDQRTLDMIDSASKLNPELQTLVSTHRNLDGKVDELSERVNLSADESVELKRLKIEKLRIRDQIEIIIHQKATA